MRSLEQLKEDLVLKNASGELDFDCFIKENFAEDLGFGVLENLIDHAIEHRDEELLDVAQLFYSHIHSKQRSRYLHKRLKIAEQMWYPGREDGITIIPGLEERETIDKLAKIASASLSVDDDDRISTFQKCVYAIYTLGHDSLFQRDHAFSVLSKLEKNCPKEAPALVKRKMDRLKPKHSTSLHP